jgi:zinc protease
MKHAKFQLKNKLKVLMIESKKSPVVSVQMWVKTGSADEKKGEEGISHFIEHLVFKGTEKFKVGEIANTVEASGGELNAYTSFDQTVFYVTISKSFSDVALNVVSQMMGFPIFDPKEIDSEREVVCEEIKMGQDSPGRRSSQLLFSTVFKKHAYGKPVIGYEKNVRGWSAKKIKQFYQSRYVPENMFLVVSGDFETAEMKAKINEYFGKFRPFKLRKVTRGKEPAQQRYQYKVQKYKIQDRHLHLAFRAPNIRHKDIPALDVLAMILGQGDSSRLVKKLRLENPVANSISAFNYNPKDEGLFAITAHYQGDHFEVISKEILNQIQQLKTTEVSWAEIKRARVAISSEQFYSIETVDGLANKAGTLEFYFNDQDAQKKYLKQLSLVTPQTVQKVAKKYLKLEKLSAAFMGEIDEAASAKQLQELPKLWKAAESQKVKLQKRGKKIAIPKLTLKSGKSGSLQVEKITLDSGLKILFSEIKDTPTVSAKFVFRGGARLEQPDCMGLSELTARTWVSATKSKNEEVLMQEIEESAIGLSCFSGKNTIGFSLEYLSVFEKKALELTMDCIENACLDSEIIAREKQILDQAIRSREDHPSSLCVRQFLKAMFGSHPLSYEATGTHESVARITREHMQEIKNKVLAPDNLTVVVVGDFKKAAWMAEIKKLDKILRQHKAVKPIHMLEDLTANKRKFLATTKEQSHVIMGWRALSLSDPDRFTLHAIEAILAGQGGRLFLELRDKNSLAYTVSPMRMESLETGYFGGYIACSHEKVEKALEMFQAEFKKLCDEDVGAEELERAKKYLIGQHDIGLQKKSALCNLIAFDETYGNDYRQSLHIADEYNKVTAEKIRALANRLFNKPHVISVVGKESA